VTSVDLLFKSVNVVAMNATKRGTFTAHGATAGLHDERPCIDPQRPRLDYKACAIAPRQHQRKIAFNA
jgi:hypothetical protein